MLGSAAKALQADLSAFGLPPGTYHAVYRIACAIPPQKRTDSILRRAANACRARAGRELATLGATNLPTLYLGKWSPVGLLGRREHKEQLEIKLSHSVIRNGNMCLPHPRNPYFNAPAGKEVFRESLRRFASYALGELAWPTWDKHPYIIEPTEEALRALKHMGPIVAADVETLGKDPLVDPITVIGISDGEMTVSLNWAGYGNKFGNYAGIENSPLPLAKKLRAQIKETLETRTVVGQNLVYDLLAFERLGIHIMRTEDTLDAAKILNPELPAGLEVLGTRYLLLPSRWKTEFRAGRDDDAKGATEFTESPLEKLLIYNVKDALITRLLWDKLVVELAKED
jgi:hypothetical protein